MCSAGDSEGLSTPLAWLTIITSTLVPIIHFNDLTRSVEFTIDPIGDQSMAIILKIFVLEFDHTNQDDGARVAIAKF